MSQQITLEVSEKVFNHAAILAARKSRRLEEVLSDLLENAVDGKAVEDLSDAEVLELSKLQITVEQQKVLSDLLWKNREGELTADEKKQLNELMEICDQNLQRKAQALQVAVERGLIKPLSF